jgi:hypothetical protein
LRIATHPTLKQLRREFEQRGVRFWLVFVDPAESPDAIRSYLTAYNHHTDAVRDPRHTLVALSGATVTPEAAIYVANGQRPRLIYRGRIDDRYVDFGRARPKPSKHDLRELRPVRLSAGGAPARPRRSRFAAAAEAGAVASAAAETGIYRGDKGTGHASI